jgi:Ca2+-binding RTX toxin-like protein
MGVLCVDTGTGGITARALKGAEIFTVTNSGTGSVTLLGKANSLTLVNEGSGDLKAFEFEVLEADLTLIGSGNAELHCTESMKVLIEGSGNVYYRGNPTMEASIEGSGKVVDAN